jgi:cobalt-precorrin-7 (C5)-methyltransferase
MASEDRPVVIIGCGPGSADYVTPAARRAASQADVLIGAERLLGLFPDSPAEKVPIGTSMQDTIEAVGSRFERQRIGVLVTGDPGLFSLARLVVKRFGRQSCTVIPGVSSVQAAFAAIGLDWAGARIISAHKEDPNEDGSFADEPRIAVLGGREASLKWIAERLLPVLDNHAVFLCENLTLADESVREVRPDELAGLAASSRSVILIIHRSLLT